MFRRKQDNPVKPSWLRRLIGWGPLVLVLVVWVISYPWIWTVTWETHNHTFMALNGSGYIVVRVMHIGSLGGPSLFEYSIDKLSFDDIVVFPYPYVWHKATDVGVALTHWLLAIPAALWLWFIVFRRRPMPGHCPKCDYDLRGSIGASTCPECGADVTAVAPKST